jgi:hypothetical protein
VVLVIALLVLAGRHDDSLFLFYSAGAYSQPASSSSSTSGVIGGLRSVRFRSSARRSHACSTS